MHRLTLYSTVPSPFFFINKKNCSEIGQEKVSTVLRTITRKNKIVFLTKIKKTRVAHFDAYNFNRLFSEIQTVFYVTPTIAKK